MCGEYYLNRERLAQLIYWMRTFTEDEFIETLRQLRNLKTEIGRVQSLHDYLENLRKLGSLGFEKGRYILLNPAKGRRSAAA
jgi:hypothetical protein